jgi:hypothetical protein
MGKQKQQEYQVTGRIDIEVGVSVRAASVEEAVAKSKDLSIDDFVTVLGEHNDSTFRITGVSVANDYPSKGQ